MQSLIDKYQREENKWKALPQDHLIFYFIFKGIESLIRIGLILYGMQLGIDLTDVIRLALLG